jgi:hypothetical protein
MEILGGNRLRGWWALRLCGRISAAVETALLLGALGGAAMSVLPESLWGQAGKASLPFVALRTKMTVDVDGAPNAYGPRNLPTLDFLKNAHTMGRLSAPIVGYLTRNDDGRTPVIQGPKDPCPGYYVSTTDFNDDAIENDADPRKYLDARKISYVVVGNLGKRHHVQMGDLAVVHSDRTHRTVYAVVGDSGNPSGGEGSLALLRALGYPFHDGKDDAVEKKEIVIRYFPGSNPTHRFFHSQAEIDRAGEALKLNKDF